MGRIVVVSASNDGEYGSWYASSPSSGLNVISVGSVKNTILNIQDTIVSNECRIHYMLLENLEIPAGVPIYATSQDPTIVDNACNPLSSNTPDLSNCLVLICCSTCPFVNKTNNTAAYSTQYFLIYNNVNGPLVAISTNYTSTLISQQDGLFLLQEGIPNNYTISFSDSPLIIENPIGGLMSPFSTYGPTYNMYLKPAISAPGGAILSTIPVALGSWSIESRTSIAAPYIAGSAALLLKIKGNKAKTASLQGAGLINVYHAIKNIGSLLPAELLLNNTANFNGTHTLTIRNGRNKLVIYTFTHVPAGTANTIQGIKAVSGPIPLTGSSANMEFAPTELNIPAGELLQVQVTIAPPAKVDATRFPVFSGYIRATGSDNTTLQCTYMGLAASLKDAKLIDNTDDYFGVKLPLIIDKDGNPVAPDQTITYTLNDVNTPLVIYRLAMGTPLLCMHLVDSTTNVTCASRCSTQSNNKPAGYSDRFTTLGSNYPKRSVMDWVFSRVCQSCGGVPTLGVLLEAEYFPRNTISPTPEQGGYSAVNIRQFSNGTMIPDGDYRIKVQALKIFGDLNAPGDYEVWTSPAIQIRRALD
ncbi:Subtilisin-like protein, partial [Rhizoctonia solani]